MPILFNHELKYILIAPPKNGCSSIRQWFIDFNNLNCKIEYLIDETPDNISHKYDTYTIYYVYRNIYDRFISYCENILHNRLLNKNICQNDVDWNNFLNMFTQIMGTHLSITTKLTSVLNFFKTINVDTLENSTFDVHHLSHYYWLNKYCNIYNIDQTKIIFVNILDIDTIIFSFLEKIHNKKINIRYQNITFRDDNSLKELDIDEININNIFSQKKFLFKNKIYLDTISNLYKNDKCIIDNCDKYFCTSFSDKILNSNKIPSDFNYITYLNLNTDLKTNNIQDKNELIKHYILYGNIEKRKYKYEHIPIDFNWIAYIHLNNDLKQFDEINALNHYEYEGYIEKRKYKYDNIPNDFNWIEYIYLNDDLKQFDEISALNHYEYDGYKENRKYKFI
jgi:hypothetical protein